ncbi:EndoU domain-containing protein [Bacillus sp. ZJS3]|uniref:EndoU domain-containing protein n=1 Tax=Bacillus TaxID=1386 RepID=UPI001FB46B40|nr:EndoU domain-containing protein [Bacillus sp. ZJS3]UOB78502.1 EndoU domain-containing protein [Bacillus sp. ZJS3]HDR3651703.1 EndoU domain-containing protein [Bacillus anthracis]
MVQIKVTPEMLEEVANHVQIAPNKYIGQTSSGFKVEMIIENGEITTAYPKYTRR